MRYFLPLILFLTLGLKASGQNPNLVFNRVVSIDTTISCPTSSCSVSTSYYKVPIGKVWKIEFLSGVEDNGEKIYWYVNESRLSLFQNQTYSTQYKPSTIWINENDSIKATILETNSGAVEPVGVFISALEFSVQ